MADDVHPGLVPLYGSAALLDEIRLLRRMGDDGRRVAVLALRSARLGPRPENPGYAATGAAAPTLTLDTASMAGEDPMKLMTRRLDAAIVKGGGKSIYACKPRGDMSTRAAKRLERWQWVTPRRHAAATGRKPKDER